MNIYDLIKELENITMDNPNINFKEVPISMNSEYPLNKVSFSSYKHIVSGKTCYGIELDP